MRASATASIDFMKQAHDSETTRTRDASTVVLLEPSKRSSGCVLFLRNLPNLLSCLRIAGSVLLLLLPAMQPAFYAVYAACGLSDMLDGFLARRLGVASRLGSILDSAADLLFLCVSALKIVPQYRFPFWVWVAVCGILFVRLCTLFIVFAKSSRLTLPLHTNANRLTGLLLYLFAPILNSCMGSCLLIVLCCVAAFAAVQELTIVCSPMPSAENTYMRKS